MEPGIGDGDLCVFRRLEAGTRQGMTVLAQWVCPEDPETGGAYAVKRYSSRKREVDGQLEGFEVILSPTNPGFEPIVLTPEFDGEVSVVAVLIEVLRPPS